MSQEEDDAESALVAELRAIAGDDARRGDDTFVVRRRSHTIEVVHYGGSSSSLRLRARYDAVARADHPARTEPVGEGGSYRQTPPPVSLRAPRPLAIELRKKLRKEVGVVADGVARPHQTGDRAFDEAVIVETPTTNDAVLRAVLGPEVRGAALSLFELGFLRVAIDDDDVLDGSGVVEAYLSSFALRDPPPERGARCLDAFARLLDHLPAVAPSGEKHPPPDPGSMVRFLGWVGAIGIVAGAPAWWLVSSGTQCIECGTPGSACESRSGIALTAAIAVGVIAAWVAGPALIRRLGNRQGSFIRVGGARLKVFAGCAVLAFFAVLLAFRLACH